MCSSLAVCTVYRLGRPTHWCAEMGARMLDACSYPLKITPVTRGQILDFLTFKICYQAGAQSFKHYPTYLYKITSMNKIEIKIYKFPQEDNVSMFDIGLFYSMNKIEIKIYKFPQEDNVSMFDIGLFYSICVLFVTVTS